VLKSLVTDPIPYRLVSLSSFSPSSLTLVGSASTPRLLTGESVQEPKDRTTEDTPTSKADNKMILGLDENNLKQAFGLVAASHLNGKFAVIIEDASDSTNGRVVTVQFWDETPAGFVHHPSPPKLVKPMNLKSVNIPQGKVLQHVDPPRHGIPTNPAGSMHSRAQPE